MNKNINVGEVLVCVLFFLKQNFRKKNYWKISKRKKNNKIGSQCIF